MLSAEEVQFIEKLAEATLEEVRKEQLKKPVFFNQNKLAERWKISPPTISRWVSEGRIKPSKHPLGWSLAEVEDMEASNC